MMRNARLRRFAALLLCLVPALSLAHSFSTPYILPIPFWIYVYGCVATLVVTFAVLGVFAGSPAAPVASAAVRAPQSTDGVSLKPRWLVPALRAGALGCLLLCMMSGFIGTPDPARNINITLFWVAFLLGFAYLVALIGDLYALIDPWRTLVDLLQRAGLNLSGARVNYPQSLGHWPAFMFYLALIWMELFVETTPRTLSIALLIYSAITFVGVAIFGRHAWFEKADVFANYFRLYGKLAPVEYIGTSPEDLRLRFRAPFAGLLSDPPRHVSLVLLVLCMLSSTAYDAIYDTQYWTAFFWENLLWILQPLWGTDLAKAQSLLMSSFLVYRKVGLLIFPFLYLAVYVVSLLAAKLLSRTDLTLRTLSAAFCYSLLPIVVAYNFAHYYTFLVAQADAFPWLVTDPLGLGWNLLGLEQDIQLLQDPALQMGVIWHTQVSVILIGHIASVAVAHKAAIRVFATRRQVISSQLPVLLLMVAYTMLGLWILTLPLA